MRFVWLQALLLAAAAWVLWPLRDASTLPNPPWPQYTPEPPDLQETIAIGPTTLIPGTQGAIIWRATRVIVYDPRSGSPLSAQVRISLAPRGRPDDARHLLYEGTTDNLGTVSAAFRSPLLENIEWDVVVDVAGRVGTQRIVRPVTIHHETRIELAVDRLAYHPGETIHLWLRALDGASISPLSGQPVTFAVYDARDNLIWRERAVTSAYGVAFAACRLANGAGLGDYRVIAGVEDAGSPNAPRAASALAAPALAAPLAQRMVEVKAPVSPRFTVAIEVNETYALAGQRIAGTVTATYPWGQPLAGTTVAFSAALQGELARQFFLAREVALAQGETDAQGAWRFDLDLEDDRVSGADSRSIPLRLSALVTDAEGHTQEAEAWLPAAGQALLIQAEAESGALKPGLDNLIHARIVYPDGRPAACTLTVDAPGLDRPEQLETDADGRGQWSYRPPDHLQSVTTSILARDAQGREAQRQVQLPVEAGDKSLLLRPERASYGPGETMHVDVLLSPAAAAGARAVYLDVIREGQMAAAHVAPVRDGRAAFDVPPVADGAGPITLHAYTFPDLSLTEHDLAPVADVRQIAMPASALTVTVRTDKTQYAPGDTARMSIQVTGPRGSGEQSALTMAMTLAEARPPERASALPPEPPAPLAAPESALTATRAGVVSRARPTPERVIREFEAVASARAARRRAFTALAGRLIAALIAAAGAMCLSALGGAWGRHGQDPGPWRRGLVGRALGGLIVVPLLGVGAALLAYGVDKLFGPGTIVVLGLAWLGVLLALLVYAWQRCDGWAQVLWASTIDALALGAGLRYALAQGAELSQVQISAGLAALALAVLTSYGLATALARRGERGGTGAVWALIVVLLVTSTGAILVGVPRQENRPTLPEPGIEAEPVLPPIAGTVGTQLSRPVEAELPRPSGETMPSRPAGAGLPRLSGGTVFWAPHVLTDEQGRFSFDVPIPDRGAGPVDWLVSVAASSVEGASGAGQARWSVSRPLWIETSLPSSLTVGDELDLPISIYNNFGFSQTVQVTTTLDSWFAIRLQGTGSRQIEVAGHDVGVLYVPIRVREWGQQRLEMTAQSEQGRDRLSQEVNVLPGGLRIWRVYDGQVQAAPPASSLSSDDLPPAPATPSAGLAGPSVKQADEPPETRLQFRVPWSAVRGTERVSVTLYANWESVLIESLEAVRPPAPGQQTLNSVAAAIRTNALLHATLETGAAPPFLERDSDIEAGIRAVLASSYQQLLTFEAADGGFAPLAHAPPDVYHTAEALSCLSELAGLIPVDEALMDRTARWLFQQQTDQGTWLPARVPPSWESMPRLDLPATAYAAWSLIEAGYSSALEVRLAVEHLARYPDKAQDPYTLALAIHALAAYKQAQPGSSHREALTTALDLLAERAEVEQDGAVWRQAAETFTGAVEDAADVESAALAVYALLRTQSHPQLAARGLGWLAAQRDGYGRWGSDTMNWLAARAFWAAVQWGHSPFLSSTVSVTVDEVEAAPLTLRSIEPGAVQSLAFDVLSKGYNDVVLTAEGIGPVPYRVAGTYVLPWDQIEPSLPEQEDVTIEVRYDRTELAVGETITATVDVMLNRSGMVPLTVLELGLPPGLETVERQWDELVESGAVIRYRREGEQMIVYLADLSAEEPVRFTYQLRAAFPLWVRTLPTRAYDVANPGRVAVRQPILIQVE